MLPFPLLDETTAPAGARPALTAAQKNFGMIPNLEKVMASAPPLLTGYTTLWDLFETTTLTPIERQVVYLTANFENECNYADRTNRQDRQAGPLLQLNLSEPRCLHIREELLPKRDSICIRNVGMAGQVGGGHTTPRLQVPQNSPID
jgi:hypothetical protein